MDQRAEDTVLKSAEAAPAAATEPARSKREEEARTAIPGELPVLPVRSLVIFPGTVVPISVAREKSKRMVEAVLAGNKLLAIFAQRREDVEDPGINDVYRVGTVAQVLKLLRAADGTFNLLVHGMVRCGMEHLVGTEPYWTAAVVTKEDDAGAGIEIEALAFNARRLAEQIIELSPNVPEEATQILRTLDKPGPLADFLAANLSLGLVQKQELLETFDVADRLRKISATLQNQLEVLELAQKIQTDVRTEIDKTQRQYFLQEQLKAIQKELGEGDTRGADLDELRKRLAAAAMPEAVRKEADREFGRLQRISPVSPENAVIRDYLEWLCELPWNAATVDDLDLDRAARVLDEDHYGLQRIKRRILEYLAVRRLKPDGRSPILCFAGPPGVGKTSLGQSIARALGRKFVRIALGGVRDEADIRGHRRTYIGSMPGRIMQEIRKVGSRNPVVMLDELDKLGEDFRGSPASALLEVLDPEQNHSFTDHYLGVPFDLSGALFIGTANYMDPVEPALKDRMEIIDLPGYTNFEKLEIAKRYVAPRQIERNGLSGRGVAIPDDAIRRIIDSYTREAGVRNLERSLGTVCRGIAARAARNQPLPQQVDDALLNEFLGPPRFERELAMRTGVSGVATGLAYTPVGGEILFIEATSMPGRGSFSLTGQLGDVMRESGHAALTLIRAHAGEWGLGKVDLSKYDVHVHVPAGAVPKDGPSAGVAMLTALYSLLSGTVADPTVGMTGEITLRGLVLPIGGVSEKVLAGHRAGLRKIILPARNEPDVAEIPKEVRDDLTFVYVSNVEELLAAAIPALRISRRRRPTARRAAKRTRGRARG